MRKTSLFCLSALFFPMRLGLCFMFILFTTNLFSQKRVSRLSINIPNMLYTYGEGKGHLNNVVRYSDGISLTFKSYDTSRKSGMLYEVLTNTTIAYYKNILGGDSILAVDDLHTNLVAIMPLVIYYNNTLTHTFGVGLSIGSLTSRDYYDQTNKLLSYNSTTLQELKLWKYWTSGVILDYLAEWRFSKRWGGNIGIRLTSSTPVGSRGNFVVTQGNSISIKYGLFYQFK